MAQRLIKLVTLVAALTFVPPMCWPLEIITNCSHYLLPFATLALFFSFSPDLAGWRITRLVYRAVLLGFVVRSVFVLSPFYIYRSELQATDPTIEIKIAIANLYKNNQHFDDLKDIIETEKPDIVGLLEYSGEAQTKLALEQLYPYFLGEVREDAFGIALYSKYPLGDFNLVQLGFPELPPVIATSIRLPSSTIGFFLVHTKPPVTQRNIDLSYMLLRRLSTLVRHSQGDLIFAGDFNFTPFSWRYDKFMEWTELDHASWGRGLSWSWNALSWFLRFRLDHVFYRGAVEVGRDQLLRIDQSDHRLQLLTLKLGATSQPFSPPATTLQALLEKE